MAAITYTANARAPLITDSPAHTAGTAYSFDVKLQAFSETIETPKTIHTSLAGGIETVLQRSTRIYQAVFIWPDSNNGNMEEFLFSVAAGETFAFSPYGSVGDSPDLAFDVVCINAAQYQIGRLQQQGSTPWRSVSLSMRPRAVVE